MTDMAKTMAASVPDCCVIGLPLQLPQVAKFMGVHLLNAACLLPCSLTLAGLPLSDADTDVGQYTVCTCYCFSTPHTVEHHYIEQSGDHEIV